MLIFTSPYYFKEVCPMLSICMHLISSLLLEGLSLHEEPILLYSPTATDMSELIKSESNWRVVIEKAS